MPDLITFVTERVNEDRYFHRRSNRELDALHRIALTAWGCPGCGLRSDVAHACPGLPGGAPYEGPTGPWVSVLGDLAILWSAHRDYRPGWNTPERLGL